MSEVNFKCSDYYNKLKLEYPDVALRYFKKIESLCLDPYIVKETDLLFNTNDVPQITSMDIFCYLTLSNSYYTNEQMKAYKSLDSYKFFEAGFVESLGVIKCGSERVIVGKVKHSQKLSQPSLKSWVKISSDGSIVTAHCTCMAGAGEVCSHVGATLFAAEFITTSKSVSSCTDVLALWKRPAKKGVENTRVHDIVSSKNTRDIPLPSEEWRSNLLQSIVDVGGTTVLERVLLPFSKKYVIKKDILVNIFNLYNERYCDINLQDLKTISKTFIFFLNEKDRQEIERATTGQSKTETWFLQKLGRITASNLKAVCRTSVDKPSLTTVKKVCYGSSVQTMGMRYGLLHESKAVKKLIQALKEDHHDLRWKQVGLCIDEDYPQLAASPDLVVECSCCGLGTVEVKCPFTLKKSSFSSWLGEKSCCLNDELTLKRNHVYYYQTQMQMAICKADYGYFAVWCPEKFIFFRVDKDVVFWEEAKARALRFHQEVILPELMAKYFTRKI